MRVLIAPDKFKGSLSAARVARAIGAGLAAAGAHVHELPLADGGDGSIEAAVAAGFERVAIQLTGGRSADLALQRSSATAVVEVAGTCGLSTPEAGLPALRRSSQAVGTAVLRAQELGARRIVLALGGSSTTDGGIGFLHALGARFLDERGVVLAPTAASLPLVREVDPCGMVQLRGSELVLATDVDNPLCGPRGAAAVFGPQKGLSGQQLSSTEAGLRHFVHTLTGAGWARAADLAAFPGAGAAGGLGWAGMLLGGRQTSGAQYFLDLLGFEEAVAGCDVVITGEGRLDAQTAGGKLPQAVAARSAPRPVIAVVGRCDVPVEDLHRLGISQVHSISQLAGRDTATEPVITLQVLHEVGARLAQDLAHPSASAQPVLTS